MKKEANYRLARKLATCCRARQICLTAFGQRSNQRLWLRIFWNKGNSAGIFGWSCRGQSDALLPGRPGTVARSCRPFFVVSMKALGQKGDVNARASQKPP